jgi:biotin operon repressor/anti-sigma regulatory factor (Ser/Thr protein kinase)
VAKAKTDRLLKYLESHSPASGPDLCRHLGITRQALSKRLRPLIAAGEVVKSGSTRKARYFVPGKAPPAREVSKSLKLKNADESRVYEEAAVRLNFDALLRRDVESIVHYAFTEMLNNAIEHSRSVAASFGIRLDAGTVLFEVRDRGIGVFRSIADKLGLDDEHAAMVELIKGRTTTMPEAHSGEGIFFTSRAADRFSLRSHKIQLLWDRARGDTFVSDVNYTQGTRVEFMLRRDTRRRLPDVFSDFAPEEYDFRFEKTKVLVRLLQQDYVSRSEARRLTANLEKFREVVLDFSGVESVGQGFADEVLRVFAARYPHTAIKVENASPAVAAMLRHAGADLS